MRISLNTKPTTSKYQRFDLVLSARLWMTLVLVAWSLLDTVLAFDGQELEGGQNRGNCLKMVNF